MTGFWDAIFMSPSEKAPYRVCLAWRMMRMMAKTKGILSPEEPLETLAHLPISPFTEGVGCPPPLTQSTPDNWPLANCLQEEPSLPLVPLLGSPSALQRFTRACYLVSYALDLDRGSPEIPNLPILGDLSQFFDPDTLPDIWPSLDQILLFENRVLDEVSKDLNTLSRHGAVQNIRQTLGLTDIEAWGLVKMSILRVSRYSSLDLSDHKSYLLTRLEDIQQRAREAADLNAEIQATKAIANVAGMTRTKVEDTMDSLINVVSKISVQPPQLLE